MGKGQTDNMAVKKWLESILLKNTNLYYKLHIIFGLFFIFPGLGFIFYAYKYNQGEGAFTP